MHLDPVIQRRFQELSDKAQVVASSRHPDKYGMNYTSGDLFLGWSTNVQNLLSRVFGASSVHYQNFTKLRDEFVGYESGFENARAVFEAAREDYEGGYLFNVRALAKAEALADAFSQASEILKAGYKDPACVLGRVALEVALKELCDEHGIPHGKLDRMNAELCKAGVYNMAKQKQVTAWAEIGNKAAHGAWDQYDEADAKLMLSGVEALVADFL